MLCSVHVIQCEGRLSKKYSEKVSVDVDWQIVNNMLVDYMQL